MSLSDGLQDLEMEWRRLGVPVERVLAPPRSGAEVRDALTELTGDVPGQLVTWFEWHDGSSGWDAAPLMLPLLSLHDAIRVRQSELATREQYPAEDEYDAAWDPTWLPLTDSPGPFRYALEASTGAVLFVDWGADPFSRVVAASLVEAVTIWLEALRGGYYSWLDSEWVHDFATVPRELRATGLVQ